MWNHLLRPFLKKIKKEPGYEKTFIRNFPAGCPSNAVRALLRIDCSDKCGRRHHCWRVGKCNNRSAAPFWHGSGHVWIGRPLRRRRKRLSSQRSRRIWLLLPQRRLSIRLHAFSIWGRPWRHLWNLHRTDGNQIFRAKIRRAEHQWREQILHRKQLRWSARRGAARGIRYRHYCISAQRKKRSDNLSRKHLWQCQHEIPFLWQILFLPHRRPACRVCLPRCRSGRGDWYYRRRFR